ncbi:probable two-component response regulator [Hahella chejuensis KCTC 2396]|uniref:Probable two-component response regulator n=1 Tax=Hahella chejuensis (strain KCTC 2396) TaxID=349521 RepID=Q2SAX3_HAHCH|nr:transcriptional regulator [Hahella chejuensis]ABC32201.1 probable two-component response regulator [Hahella chejuensis KCTC 2396]
MTLSVRINRILLAEESPTLCARLRRTLVQMAPHADIHTTASVEQTRREILEWRPVLAVIDFVLEGGNIVPLLGDAELIPAAPFVLGIAPDASRADTVQAMRCGFSYVIDKPFDLGTFEQAVLQTVSSPMSLASSINRIVSPLLYSDDDELDLKKLTAEIETLIFKMAIAITGSKKGLGRLLGISRQLVQYHLKKL